MPFLVGYITPQDYGAAGDGVTDDTTAINNALAASGSTGTPMFWPAATYLVSAPLNVPTNAIAEGPQGLRVRGTLDAAPLAVIKLAASFSGAGAFVFPANSSNQRLRWINIDGSSATGTVTGITAAGYSHDVFLDQISIYKVPGNGLNMGGSAYSWTVTSVTANGAGNNGFSLSSATDSTFYSCEAIGCTTNGWFITGTANTHFTDCRSEFSGGIGFLVAGAWNTGNGAGGSVFTSCSTDRNASHGVSITATGTQPILFNGLMLRRDGSNGVDKGLNVASATVPVTISALTVYPGVNDDGSGTLTPVTAVNVASSTYTAITSGWVHGATNAVVNGGSNTVFRVNSNVGLATGTTASPTFNYNNPWGTDNGSTFTANLNGNDQTGIAVTQAATFTNANNPLINLTTGSAVTDALIKGRISGDTSSRIIVGVDGKISLGPGSTGVDTTWYRSSSGVMKTDNTIQATTGMRLNTTSTGGSTGAFSIADATTAPTSNPTGGGILYSSSGLIQWRASDGGQYTLTPPSQFVASDHGFTAWTYDPTLTSNSTITTTGTIYLARVVLHAQTTLNKAYLSIAVAASGVTANQNYIGFYDSSGTRQAVTAAGSIDASLAFSGILTATFAASYTAPPGYYWIAFVNNATTPATLGRASGFQSTPNANLATAALRWAVNGSGTSLPATITPGSNTSTNNITLWAAVSN